MSEIVAVNDGEVLVLERDGQAGTNAAFERIYKIDISSATDVRGAISTLPTPGLPSGVSAVTKSPFLDMLDPKFGLAGPTFPEKLEALARSAPISTTVGCCSSWSTTTTSSRRRAPGSTPSLSPRSDLPGYMPQEIRHGRHCARHDHDDDD